MEFTYESSVFYSSVIMGQRPPQYTTEFSEPVWLLLLMCNTARNRVNHNDLPILFTGKIYRCRCPAPTLSVVDCQQTVGVLHHEIIALQHTALIICAADIYPGIRPLDNIAIPFPCKI